MRLDGNPVCFRQPVGRKNLIQLDELSGLECREDLPRSRPMSRFLEGSPDLGPGKRSRQTESLFRPLRPHGCQRNNSLCSRAPNAAAPAPFPLAADHRPGNLEVVRCLLAAVESGLGGVVNCWWPRPGKVRCWLRGLQPLLPPRSTCLRSGPKPGRLNVDPLASRRLGLGPVCARIKPNWGGPPAAPIPSAPVPNGGDPGSVHPGALGGQPKTRLVGSVECGPPPWPAGAAVVSSPAAGLEAHRGVLYVDELTCLDDGHQPNLPLAWARWAVARTGIEREGPQALSHPCGKPC